MKATIYKEPRDKSINFSVNAQMNEIIQGPDFLKAILNKTADIIAEEIIKNHLPEILEKISPEAIANMTIAAAGAKINETLSKKIPDKILNIETQKTAIYKSGLFGGLKQIG